jgi:hypothetical protein
LRSVWFVSLEHHFFTRFSLKTKEQKTTEMRREELIACIRSSFASLPLPHVLHGLIIDYIHIYETVRYRPSPADPLVLNEYIIDRDCTSKHREGRKQNARSTTWSFVIKNLAGDSLRVIRGNFRHKHGKGKRKICYVVHGHIFDLGLEHSYAVAADPTDEEWIKLRKRITSDSVEPTGDFVML